MKFGIKWLVTVWAINTGGKEEEVPVSLEPCRGYNLSTSTLKSINQSI